MNRSTAGGEKPPSDIRFQLRTDHHWTLAELEALAREPDAAHVQSSLRRLRRAWVIHALAEETVVYRALEGVEAAGADERFAEHETIEGCFEKLSRVHPGSPDWHARLEDARAVISRHVAAEHQHVFGQLERDFDAAALEEMGRRFEMAREKLTVLEEAKAA